MLRLFSRGKSIPQDQSSSPVSRTVLLHRAKLAAWAIAVGERPRSADPPYRSRRQHRGMLDDLPRPETPELAPMPALRAFVGLLENLLQLRSPAAGSEAMLSGDPKTPVGQTASVTYIDRSDADESKASAPSGADRRRSKSRAA